MAESSERSTEHIRTHGRVFDQLSTINGQPYRLKCVRLELFYMPTVAQLVAMNRLVRFPTILTEGPTKKIEDLEASLKAVFLLGLCAGRFCREVEFFIGHDPEVCNEAVKLAIEVCSACCQYRIPTDTFNLSFSAIIPATSHTRWSRSSSES